MIALLGVIFLFIVVIVCIVVPPSDIEEAKILYFDAEESLKPTYEDSDNGSNGQRPQDKTKTSKNSEKDGSIDSAISEGIKKRKPSKVDPSDLAQDIYDSLK